MKNRTSFEKRIFGLNKQIFSDIRLRYTKENGHLIMRQLKAEQIIGGDNKGDVVFVYCSRAEDLHYLLGLNCYYFYIEAMGVKNRTSFEKRIFGLNKQIFSDIRLRYTKENGHLIMRQLKAEQIIGGDNKGDVVFVYCSRAEDLYYLLRLNYYYFYIEAMGDYQNPIQCYFNYKRSL